VSTHDEVFESLSLGEVTLLPGIFRHRHDLNRTDLLSLWTSHLLQNHYLEAGLWAPGTRQ
jgi:uncharacterized protein